MERQASRKSVERAARLIAERGKVYQYPNGRLSVWLFSTKIMEMDLVRRVFGGNYHTHMRDDHWQWYLGKKEDLLYLTEQVLPLLDNGDERATQLASWMLQNATKS